MENKVNEENLSYFILNETNKLLDIGFINKIFEKYKMNHKVVNKQIFQTAFIHSSYMKSKIDEKKDILIKSLNRREILEKCNGEAIPFFDVCYEHLEFLGDSVIHGILTEYLFKRYEEENDEGFMTKLRIKLEGGHMMSVITRTLGFCEYIIFAKYIETEYGRDRQMHILEDVLEAFIGALFIDTNYDYDLCRKFLVNLIEEEINFAQILNIDNNYKDTLLQHFHKMKWGSPEYYMLEQITGKQLNGEVNSPKDKRFFKMCVKRQSQIIGTGYGVSKKIGEQMAAKDALRRLKILRNDDINEIVKE